MEANLITPGLPWYNEDVLFLVILDNKYGERVPIQISTLVTDHLVMTMTTEEVQQAGDTWKWVHLSIVILEGNTVEGLNVPKYNLKGVKGRVHTMSEVLIPPFMTIVVKGIAKLMTHGLFGPHCHCQIL